MKFKFEFDEEMWKKAAFCARCGTCRTVHAEQIEGQETGWQCPSGTNYFFEAYYPSGRNYAALAFQRGQLDWSDRVLDSLYSCTTCGFCQYTCERTNVLKPTEIIRWMRSKAVEAGVGPLPAQRIIVQNLEAYDNPWGQPRTRRTNWTRDLGFEIKDLSKGKEKAEVLFYPGCTYAYDPRITEYMRDIVRLMHEAGVDFGILGNAEKCCGSTAFNLGYIKVLEKYGAENIEAFNKLGIKTIVTPCSGCYNTIGNVYAQLGECKFEVKHSLVLLAELIEQKKLKPTHSIDAVVTYHDPCHLGRHGKIFDPPREIIKSIPGLTLVEMNRIREYSFCCGGGGGARTGKLEFALATARRRVKEAEGTGAKLLATACPFCEQNFLDYMDATGSSLDLVDVVALLKKSVFGEQKEKK
ncbi:MAG: (Fe-S)-binding protein [Deltaproteobacteria bacterium]|nr:(Fe-S)-binding protein [Deltaproteobacteria bacterium]